MQYSIKSFTLDSKKENAIVEFFNGVRKAVHVTYMDTDSFPLITLVSRSETKEDYYLFHQEK